MTDTLYTKSSRTLSMISRDFLTISPGNRVETIASYTNRLGVSRGIVQESFAILENDHFIELEKRGSKGTTLKAKDFSGLFTHSGWGVIKGTMPTPVNRYLRSLATSIFVTMKFLQIPFSFSYIMGGERRSDMLQKEAYDFCLVTENTAKTFTKKYPDLEISLHLAPCIYSDPFALFINKPNVTELEDGMTVALDSACYDQTELSYKYAEGKNVSFVEYSAIVSPEMFNEKKVDALVTRRGNLLNTGNDISIIPIHTDFEGQYPVLLTNKNNYKIADLLRAYLHPRELYLLQQSVLEDPSKEEFE